MTRVLFVCLGNICRSPIAEAIFADEVEARGLEADYDWDSAGTGGWHEGETPDPRSIAILAKHGHNWRSRARKLLVKDLAEFDLLVAMDRSNLADIRGVPGADASRIRLLLDGPVSEVPDPYYGGPEGFEKVYQLVRGGVLKLLDELEASRKSA
ncbi:MAG: low molecular weight phosphotyrosine protein phosphatase [Chthonomonas sp.]|nr:low molecular weight phosphotyrosine protein phosphatase [Chthonomonas sp.]